MDVNETLLMEVYTAGGGRSSSNSAYFADYETPFGNGSGQNIMNHSELHERLNNGTLKEPDPTMVFNSSHLVSIITYSCLFVLSAAGKNHSISALCAHSWPQVICDVYFEIAIEAHFSLHFIVEI